MSRVFVSYAHADAKHARRLLGELRKVSLVGWRGAADLAAGKAIASKIREALRDSSAVIVLISPRSLESSWVNLEMGAAWAMGKRIVPVIIEGEGIEALIPEPLHGLAWIDARSKPPDEVAREVERALKS